MHQKHHPGAPERAGVSILLIDPDPMNREVASTILRYAGFRVTEADGPAAGLRFARQTRPALIVTELFHRTADGWHLLEDLAAAEETASIPVLAYSSWAFPADEEAARRSGATRYVAKPLHPHDFEALVEDLLLGVESGGGPSLT